MQQAYVALAAATRRDCDMKVNEIIRAMRLQLEMIDFGRKQFADVREGNFQTGKHITSRIFDTALKTLRAFYAVCQNPK